MAFGYGARIAVGVSALIATSFVTTATSSAATPAGGCLSTVGRAPAVSVTAKPLTPAWEAQYAQAERRFFGLDASAAAVSAAAADHAATSADLGIALTTSERATLDSFALVAQSVDTVAGAARSAGLASVLTTFVDPAAPSIVDVAVTDDGCSAVRALSASSPGTVHAVRVPGAVSAAASAAALGSLDNRLDALAARGAVVDLAGVDAATGRLHVTLDKSSAADAVATLRGLLTGPGVDITTGGSPQQAADARTDPSTAHVYGGQDINNGRERCTSNISAKYKGKYYVLTAGHCWTSKGTSVSQNNSTTNLFAYSSAKSIGKSLASPVHSGASITCDCLLVGPISASQATHATLIDKNAVYTFNHFARSSKYFTGSPKACESGVTEYRSYGKDICGKVSDSDTTVRVSDGSFTYTVTHVFAVSYPSGLTQQAGDSGGSVGSGKQLLGAVTTTGNPGYESRVANLGAIYSGASVIVSGV